MKRPGVQQTAKNGLQQGPRALAIDSGEHNLPSPCRPTFANPESKEGGREGRGRERTESQDMETHTVCLAEKSRELGSPAEFQGLLGQGFCPEVYLSGLGPAV